ncbi:MAG TPA: hypothetical protein VL486_01785 [Verrucomicrobiae bacterium]|nr:hypothetical protein [Verrucomicrobiae bacterium]
MSKRAKGSGGRGSPRVDAVASGPAGRGALVAQRPSGETVCSSRLARWEWVLLGVILAVGAYLRFSHLDLLEFQGDEAYAANLALGFVKHGRLPAAGLMSSVGVTNPPLFIYLLIPLFAICTDPVCVSCCIAVLGLSAVAICWWVGHKYYGSLAGLVAAALFAVSPWAVIYSRKIWAQDFVPVLATGTLWAVHAVALGRKPKAIFWCVLLPLSVVQIHFSGLALTAAVIVILACLRPRIDWRLGAAGLAAALVLMIPYLQLQSRTGWADLRQAMNTVGGGQQWEQLQGMTIHPVTGYRLPSRNLVGDALAVMDGGRIEDVLGISASSACDRAQVWAHKRGGTGRYFAQSLTLGDGLLWLERLAFVAGFVWMVAVHRLRMKDELGRRSWILVPWLIVPLLVFWIGGVWVYLSYFVILYPAHFLVCGMAAERFPRRQRWLAVGAATVLVAGNIIFMVDFYRFVGRNGGAQGTFGTALGVKQQAARFLAERGGLRLRAESEAQLRLATARTPAERRNLAESLGQPMLLELNHEGQAELPQLEWPLLVTQRPAGPGLWPTNSTILLVDGNREALQPQQWQQLAQYPRTNFGPISIFFVKR